MPVPMLMPWAQPVPPMRSAQTKLPLESSLETKMSFGPTLTRLETPVPGSKSTAVPEAAVWK